MCKKKSPEDVEKGSLLGSSERSDLGSKAGSGLGSAVRSDAGSAGEESAGSQDGVMTRTPIGTTARSIYGSDYSPPPEERQTCCKRFCTACKNCGGRVPWASLLSGILMVVSLTILLISLEMGVKRMDQAFRIVSECEGIYFELFFLPNPPP